MSCIKEDVILGMFFLMVYNCFMEFQQFIIQVDGYKLKCTDRYGRLLISSVQIIKELVVFFRIEMVVFCRVIIRNFCFFGVIEGQIDGLSVVTSLNRFGVYGKVVVRCLNVIGQFIRFKVGIIIGIFIGVEERQVEDFQL